MSNPFWKHHSRFAALILALALAISAAGCTAPAVSATAPASSASPSVPAEAESASPQVAESAPPQVSEPSSSVPAAGASSSAAPQPAAVTQAPDGTISLTAEEMDLSRRDATAKNGMVATASPLASKVGVEILQKGGNAVDAAVAVAYALGLVEPNASGVGGDGYMLVYDAKTKKSSFIDYKCEVPAALTLDLYKTLDSETYSRTGLGALVPGFVAGMEKANELFGTMTMAELIQPAIDFAEKGVVVTPFMAQTYMDNFRILNLYPETQKTFLNGGLPYTEGEIFTNPNYGKTLRIIARQGSAGFYKGPVAKAIVDSLGQYKGIMTLDDLANFKVAVREPLSADYRGYTIVTSPPGAAGAFVLESLNMAENYDIAKMGANSVNTLHLWAEIFKLATVDRYKYIGDPAFSSIAPMKALTSQAYADSRVKLVDMNGILGRVTAGDPTGVDEGAHTTHVSIIDKNGNMVSMTNTVSEFFGCGITAADYGFFLNNQTFNLSKTYQANQPHAGQKVRSSICPTFIFDPQGRPLAAVGSPGAGRIPTTMTQIVSNIVDFKMDIQEAADQPRIYQGNMTPLSVEGHMDPAVIEGLKKKGHAVSVLGPLDFFFGGVQGVAVDLTTGMLRGAADPRRDGKALGY